jgi:hypothetical protein
MPLQSPGICRLMMSNIAGCCPRPGFGQLDKNDAKAAFSGKIEDNSRRLWGK